MSPHADDFYGMVGRNNLINQPVMDINASRMATLKISYQFFIGWRILKRILSQNINQSLSRIFQIRFGDTPGVFTSLRGVVNLPRHQGSFVEHRERGVFIPVRMDLRIPGIDIR